jgi:hypothetical protein
MATKKGSTKKQVPRDGYINVWAKDARKAKALVKKRYDLPPGAEILATRVQVKNAGPRPLPYPYIYEIEVYVPYRD